MPALILLFLFIGVPVLEIMVFIEVGGAIGLGWTIAIVIVTALAGSALLRAQGLATLRRAQASMARNELPLREVFDGVCLIVAGALLLTPGFVTDALGGVLFLPPARSLLGAAVGRWLRHHASFHSSPSQGPSWPEGGPVIEGEWEDLGDQAKERERRRNEGDK